jgi:hypothetical protein
MNYQTYNHSTGQSRAHGIAGQGRPGSDAGLGETAIGEEVAAGARQSTWWSRAGPAGRQRRAQSESGRWR